MSAGFVAVITKCNVVMAQACLFVTRARVWPNSGPVPVTNRDKADISHRHITLNVGAMKMPLTITLKLMAAQSA
jgi:hypothetical protein